MPKSKPLNPLRKKPYKMDIARAFELRFNNGMSFGEIARHFGVSKSYVHGILQRFTNLMRPPEGLEIYEKNKAKLLSSALLRGSLCQCRSFAI